MKENKVLKAFLILLSVLMSLGLAVFFFYLGSLKIYWFYPFGGFFILDALITLIGSCKKDRYNGMKTLGGWQIFSTIVVMVYLLVMILWDNPNNNIPFNLMYIFLGAASGIKLLFAILSGFSMTRHYQPIMHAHRNGAIIHMFFFMIIAGLTVTNYFYPGSGEGLLKEKPLWIYIVDVSANGIITFVVALLALSTIVRAKVREEISTAGKFKHLFSWISDNEIGMFFGLIFTGYLTGLALMNVKTSIFYIFLAIYYALIMGIRFINYLWHRTILIEAKDNKRKENFRSSWILLFNAVVYTIFSDIIAVGAIILITNKMNLGANIYLFLFITIPFGILKFILAIRSIRVNRRQNDTYRLGLGYISLIGALFSMLEIVAISLHDLQNVFKWVATIFSVTVVKVFVLVVAVTFVVHWIRSLIINRKKRGAE